MTLQHPALEALARDWSELPFPDDLGSGAEYARKMHQDPFDFYLARLRQIDLRGDRVLDAGCGSGTWAFAMTADSGEVHAVDRNQPRIDVANWIKGRYGIENVHFASDDVTDLSFATDSFDAVFCYSVIISYLSLTEVLREFARVLRPDGLLYVCLNGLGWSMYLRDEQLGTDRSTEQMGRDGIYNTVCQQRLGTIRRHLSSGPIDPSARSAVDLLREWRRPEQDEDGGSESARILLREVGERLSADVDPMPSVIDFIQHECGPDYVLLLADDLAAFANTDVKEFSHSRAGRGYDPSEVEAICREVGFGSFRWGAEGTLTVGDARSAGSLFGGWYQGHHQVWEFLVRARRPDDTPSRDEPHTDTLTRESSSPTSADLSRWRIKDNYYATHPWSGPCRLRRYPYPYRAALAVSNDTDGMSVEALDRLHDYVNGTGSTPDGDGLGLEMGDSFWIWSPEGHLSLFHNMPYERDAHPSPETGRIAELGRAGLIDTLHGFGAWRENWSIDRDPIEWGLDRVRAMGLEPTVYVNHGGRGRLHGGGGFHMKHNIGGPWAYYQEGDDPKSDSYCMDLLRQAGFRYFWTDVCFELDKFGDYRTFQTSKARLRRAVDSYDFQRFFRRRNQQDRSITHEAFPAIDEDERLRLQWLIFNRTLMSLPARDGKDAIFFKRFRGPSPPHSGNFAAQVTTDRLDQLEEEEGAVVVYQHFGIWAPIGRGREHPSERRTGGHDLDIHMLEAFREIADRQRAGGLFVTTCRRLLDYLWVRERLEFDVVRPERGGHVIMIKALTCPVEGHVPWTPALLEGVGFTIPRQWRKVAIEVDGLSQTPPYERRPENGQEDHDVVHFPWSRLAYPPGERRRARFFARPSRRGKR